MDINNKKARILLLVIIVISVGISTFFMTIKQGYHEDEFLNYHLSNSSKILNTDGWNTIDDFTDYLAAGEHRFDYANVYKNQIEDAVHPPFYYMLLHTVCSFFPNVYSRYFSLALNILLMAAALIFLYRICLRLAGKRVYALVAVMAYALSIACITTTIYIRMYSALVMFTLAFISVTLRIFDKGRDARIYDYLLLTLTSALGLLTHYYFGLYALLCGAVFIILMLRRKEIKVILKYAAFSFAGILIMLCAYPYIIKNVVGEDRGIGLFGLDIDPVTIVTYVIYKINTYLQILAKELFCGKVWFLVLCAAVSVGFWVYFRFVKKIKIPKKAWFVIIPGFVSFALIAVVSPFNSDRYVMASLPLIAVTVAFVVIRIIKLWTFRGEIAAVIVAAISILSLVTVRPYYIYGEKELYDRKTKDCLFVGTDIKEWNKNIDKLMLYDGAMIVKVPAEYDGLIDRLEGFAEKRGIITHGKIGALAKSFVASAAKDDINVNGFDTILNDSALSSLDEITVYISVLADKNEVIRYITENTKFKEYELLYADSDFDAYYNWYDYFVETETYCDVYHFHAAHE